MASSNSTNPKTPSTELGSLTRVLKELTLVADKCYELRKALDAPSHKFRSEQRKQRKMREISEESLASARNRGAEIKQRLTDMLSSTPPLPAADVDIIEDAIWGFDSMLENIEDQRVTGLIHTIDTAHIDFYRAHVDIESIHSEEARVELKTALNVLDQALAHFRQCVEHNCHNVILDLAEGYTGLPLAAASASSTSATISSASSIGGSQESWVSLDSMVSDPTQFDRANPPSLSLLSGWLGFGTDSVATALLLNDAVVQSSFQQWRSVNGQPTIADHPENLKLVLVFFTYPRDSLINWCESKLNLTEKRADGIAFSAALFASQVVRYFENSCEDIDWKPVSAQDGLEAYEIARQRWATALQIFWFLEKMYGITRSQTSDRGLASMLSNLTTTKKLS
ncbi:hypothetical protein RRF57_008135 [Xylaria bambusicola]|uniref:Uncharacterized protein n=1 Tax=Xylaria bambusicola TaxID=326684 RepID=A0AAN7ZAU1_9PEZI